MYKYFYRLLMSSELGKSLSRRILILGVIFIILYMISLYFNLNLIGALRDGNSEIQQLKGKVTITFITTGFSFVILLILSLISFGMLNRAAASTLESNYLFEEVKNSQNLYQEIIENINEGIQLVDGNGQLIQVNNMFYEILDLSEPEMQNASFENWSAYFSQKVLDSKGFMKVLQNSIFSTSEKTNFRYEFNGSVNSVAKVIEVYTAPIYRGEQKVGTLIVHRDITSEFEVDQMKSELVSTVSHELRTPLASVLGFTELMLTRELDEQRQKKYIQTIHKEAKRLTNIINDFLDLQRMESGKQVYEKSKVDMVHCIEEVIDTIEGSYPLHSFKINIKTENTIAYADIEKIIQLLTNLIGNAAKFSPEGGEVLVKLRELDEKLTVQIIDQGVGIAEDDLPRLFTKFYRSNSTEKYKIGGTGLGLAICKEIVEAHDGELVVTSKLGFGSIFSFSIPLAEVKIKVDKTSYDSSIQKANVVIVEDDLSLALLLKEELTENHFYVSHFTNGVEAWSYILEVQPDVIIIDILLDEGMDGWQLIERIKKNTRTESIPIFISSALDEMEKGKLSGVNEYLTKPYPPNNLVKVIQKTLESSIDEGNIMIPDYKES